jgi:hypothetical protein
MKMTVALCAVFGEMVSDFGSCGVIVLGDVDTRLRARLYRDNEGCLCIGRITSGVSVCRSTQ